MFGSVNTTVNAIPIIRVANVNINRTNCNASTGLPVSMEFGAQGNTQFFNAVVVHETGHAHGLSHPGNADNIVSGTTTSTPVMRGCGGD
jgi:hypothetical protein